MMERRKVGDAKSFLMRDDKLLDDDDDGWMAGWMMIDGADKNEDVGDPVRI